MGGWGLSGRHWARAGKHQLPELFTHPLFHQTAPGACCLFFFLGGRLCFEVEVSNTVHAVKAMAVCLSSRSAFDLPEPTVPLAH